MITTLIILLVSAILFVSGKVRSDLVAICSLLALLLGNIITPEEGREFISNYRAGLYGYTYLERTDNVFFSQTKECDS